MSVTANIWLEAARPKTLPAAIAPVLIASAAAFHAGSLKPVPAGICLLFALLIQIGTNFANDYLDGIKGTDTDARIGPRRAVASGLIPPNLMKRATIVTLMIGFCLGLGLIPFGGWWLLLIGVASVACAWLYTGGPYPLAYNGLGDIFVVLFFGLIAVSCSYYVQVGHVTWEVLLLGFACGLLTNNILVVNNYRDLEEDKRAGKRTLVVYLGRRAARMQYLLSCMTTILFVSLLAISTFGNWFFMALIPPIMGIVIGFKLSQDYDQNAYFLALKQTALVVSFFGLAAPIGILL